MNIQGRGMAAEAELDHLKAALAIIGYDYNDAPMHGRPEQTADDIRRRLTQ